MNFNDNIGTEKEIKTMQEIRDSLNQIKPLVLKVLKEGLDDRFMTDSGMRTYYCKNAKKAYDYYSSIAAVMQTKVIEFHRNFPDNTPLSWGSTDLTLEVCLHLDLIQHGSPLPELVWRPTMASPIASPTSM